MPSQLSPTFRPLRRLAIGLLPLAVLVAPLAPFAPLSSATAQPAPEPPREFPREPRWPDMPEPPEPRKIGNLVEDLVAEDPIKRIDAATELEQRKDAGPEVLPTVLRVMARDDVAGVRRACTGILKRLKPTDPESIKALIDRLGDADHKVIVGAAQALQAIGPDAAAAVPVLSAMLDVENADLQSAAAYALAGIGAESRPAMPRLLALLDHPQAGKAAAAALGALGADPIEALVERASSADAGPRRDNARLALLKTTPQAASEASRILPMFASSDPKQRAFCLSVWWAMKPVDNRPVMQAMIECLLTDRDSDVRIHVVQTLRRLGVSDRPEMVDAFSMCLDREYDYFVREQAVGALRDAGAAALAAMPQLIRSLSNRDVTERQWAAAALGNLGPAAAPAAPKLVGMVGGSKEARDALTAIGEAAVEPLVRDGVNNADRAIAMWAPRVLVEMRDSAGVRAKLQELAKSPEQAVSANATGVLEWIAKLDAQAKEQEKEKQK